MFACQFDRYKFIRLPIRVMMVDALVQSKNYKIFKGLPNSFGIADHILMIGYGADDIDHEKTLL